MSPSSPELLPATDVGPGAIRAWNDSLRVRLALDGIVLVRERGLLRRRRVDAAQLSCAPAAAGKPWFAALALLAQALREPRWQRARLELTLADQLVCYQLLPWNAELRSADERQRFARFQFRQVYGALAADWEIRIEAAPPGTASVACAVDRELLAALRALGQATPAGARLGGIRPGFAALFDAVRGELKSSRRDAAVLARLEPGRLCYALLANGRWLALRQRTTSAAPADALLDAIEQELMLAEPAFERATLYVVDESGGEWGNDRANDRVDQAVADRLGSPWTSRRLALPAAAAWSVA